MCTISVGPGVFLNMKATNYPQLARITDAENLRQAWRRVQARKAAGGVDGQTVADFSAAELAELERLRQDLLSISAFGPMWAGGKVFSGRHTQRCCSSVDSIMLRDGGLPWRP